jgi:hypothetical protein
VCDQVGHQDWGTVRDMGCVDVYRAGCADGRWKTEGVDRCVAHTRCWLQHDAVRVGLYGAGWYLWPSTVRNTTQDRGTTGVTGVTALGATKGQQPHTQRVPLLVLLPLLLLLLLLHLLLHPPPLPPPTHPPTFQRLPLGG